MLLKAVPNKANWFGGGGGGCYIGKLKKPVTIKVKIDLRNGLGIGLDLGLI